MADEIGCRSAAFTYNDPTIFWEYAADVADACHERGVRAISVTAGYMCPRPRAEFYRHIDAANVDLKAFTEDFYHRVCVGHLADVLDTLVYLRNETDVWVEITTLLIPGQNDSDTEIAAECAWIAENLGVDVPLHFTAFHPDYKMMDIPSTPPETLKRARRIGLAEGCGSSTPAMFTMSTVTPRAAPAVESRRGSRLVCDAPLRPDRLWPLRAMWHAAARRLRRARRDLGRATTARTDQLTGCEMLTTYSRVSSHTLLWSQFHASGTSHS